MSQVSLRTSWRALPLNTGMPNMRHSRLTEEQQRVVHHPLGSHALVLAVAGSGKTTTLVHRVKHLIEQERVPTGHILVLMFNALARRQCQMRAKQTSLPDEVGKQVHSFHSFSYRILQRARVIRPQTTMWTEGNHMLHHIAVLKAISTIERKEGIRHGELDPEEAERAISLWKGSLIPSDVSRAGYRGHEAMPLVFDEYESLRRRANALTYDDFVPLALDALASPTGVAIPTYAHVIVDEYQDVNYGQQKLIEAIAGKHADVMVVGDDDQTIYEWRGARPQYITETFHSRFRAKRTYRYVLSRSFRFGPVIAQCAENVVAQNERRTRKPVIAHNVRRGATLTIVESPSDDLTASDRDLCDQVEALLQAWREAGIVDLRERIAVLGRTFSQLAGIESDLLRRGIPYRVLGQEPFFRRREIALLLHYIRLASVLHQTLNEARISSLLSILNVPTRFLPRVDVDNEARQQIASGGSTSTLLRFLAEDYDSPLSRSQREEVALLSQRLERLAERLTERRDRLARQDLEWLIGVLGYRDYFRDYYGSGEDSADRLLTLDSFLAFVGGLQIPLIDLPKHIDALDPGGGVPEEQQVLLTTVFRTKGLEYEVVLIPRCTEDYMPFQSSSECLVYDRAGIVDEPVLSESIESERRLFYVAITRASRTVIIGTAGSQGQGTSLSATQPRRSRFLDEIRLGPTQQLLGWLADPARVTRDDGRLKQHLRTVASEERQRTGTAQNLVRTYLPAAGLKRIAETLARELGIG